MIVFGHCRRTFYPKLIILLQTVHELHTICRPLHTKIDNDGNALLSGLKIDHFQKIIVDLTQHVEK
jgi:DNA-directed RNA polymerase subunit L